MKTILNISLALVAAGAIAAAAPSGESAKALAPVPAAHSTIATQAMLLGEAWAGPRAVAVGEEGVVLLSDDRAATWRQAHGVPVSSTLTSVSFADARMGWAVGHWGAILATTDGGENWTLQHLAVDEDRPLFAVHFFDAKSGVAVGLWSLVLTTDDGGRTWTKQTLQPPPGATKADANLLGLFADLHGHLFAAAERGLVLRSDDRGHTWTYLSTGYKGSFWAGVALADGTLLVGGQRGSVYRSEDEGRTWTKSELDSQSSITAFAAAPGGEVRLVGLDGLQASSRDGGEHFKAEARADRLALTAALATQDGRWLVASRHGIAGDAPR